MAVYKCRLCDRAFHHEMDVIGIFSELGNRLSIAPKILYTLTIMITKNDPTSQYICKVCLGHIEVNERFVNKCHQINAELMNGLMAEPTNYQYKDEIKKLSKVPIQYLYKVNSDINIIYDTLVKYMRDSEKNNTISQNRLVQEDSNMLLRFLTNSIHNSVYNNAHTNFGSSSFHENNMPEIASEAVNLQTEKSDDPTNGADCENNAAIANGMSPVSITNHDISSSKIVPPLSNLRKKPQSTIHNKICANSSQRTTGSNILRKKRSRNQLNTITTKNNNRNQIKSTTKDANVDNEVICLDDDDDDDHNEDNIDDDVVCVDDVSPLNKWVTTTNNNNLSQKTNLFKANPNTNNSVFQFQRKLVPFPRIHQQYISIQNTILVPKSSAEDITVQNILPRCSSSSSVLTEEMTVTPDITLPISSVPIGNRPEQVFFVMSPNSSRPQSAEVTEETGYHFLSSFFSSDPPTVDLTSSNDQITDPIKKPKTLKNKRQSAKCDKSNLSAKKSYSQVTSIDPESLKILNQEQPTEKSATNSALSKLRPKRAIVANPDTEQKNSILSKLGHQSDSVGWQVQLPKLHPPSYQCPICSQYFYSKGSRKNHEKNNHPLPSSSTSHLMVPAHSGTEDSVSTAQEKFLVSLNLYKLNKNQMSIADRVVHHKNLLKGLKMFGKKTGLYACNHCEYKTNRIYILWAHMSVNHINPDSDTRSSSFCFLCDRVLSKRTTLLKHIDTCTEKHEENNELSSSSIKKFVCNFCNTNYFESLSQLENHLWSHVTS